MVPVSIRHNRGVGMFLVHFHADIFGAGHKGVPFWKGLSRTLKTYSKRGALLYASGNRPLEVILHLCGNRVFNLMKVFGLIAGVTFLFYGTSGMSRHFRDIFVRGGIDGHTSGNQA